VPTRTAIAKGVGVSSQAEYRKQVDAGQQMYDALENAQRCLNRAEDAMKGAGDLATRRAATERAQAWATVSQGYSGMANIYAALALEPRDHYHWENER